LSKEERKEIGREDIRRGFTWLGAAAIIARVLDGVNVLVVMWFVSREQLGIATLAWSVAVFLEAMNGMGISTALLQTKNINHERLSAAFWYTMAIATLLVALVSGLASPLAAWFGHGELAPMLIVSTSKLWFVGAALIPLNQLNRAIRFERIAAVSTLATLAANILTCILAVWGFQAWSLVIGQTSHGLFTAIFALVAFPFRPRGRLSLRPIYPDIVFGAKVASAGMLRHFYRNADYFFIGRILGVGPLGLYRVAFDLAMTPTLAVQTVVNRSALPVYARMSDRPKELTDAFVWTLRSLSVMLAPITALLLFAAEDILGWVQAGAWLDAAPIVRWMSVAALLRCIAETFPAVFHAMNRPIFALYDSLLTMVLLVILLTLGLNVWGQAYGAVVAAWAWTLLYPITSIVLYAMLRTLIPVRVFALVASFKHAAFSLGAMGLAQLVFAYALAPMLSGAQNAIVHIAVLLLAFALYVRFAIGVKIPLPGKNDKTAREALAETPKQF
jgi:O-antigen/teichoic acid export membrane protein